MVEMFIHGHLVLEANSGRSKEVQLRARSMLSLCASPHPQSALGGSSSPPLILPYKLFTATTPQPVPYQAGTVFSWNVYTTLLFVTKLSHAPKTMVRLYVPCFGAYNPWMLTPYFKTDLTSCFLLASYTPGKGSGFSPYFTTLTTLPRAPLPHQLPNSV